MVNIKAVYSQHFGLILELGLEKTDFEHWPLLFKQKEPCPAKKKFQIWFNKTKINQTNFGNIFESVQHNVQQIPQL